MASAPRPDPGVPEPGTNRNLLFAGALFEELAAAGVRHACLCPGSRSAPLAIAAAATPGLRVWTHVDERAAAFFALGLAKAARAPVALLCTSGTAAANFLPAVIEASFARVPLVVLTADRPPELRDWGAAQTIDQLRLFGTHVRWFAELPPPEPRPALLRHLRATAARAAAVASGPPAGPVHLNLPYREPLEPTPLAGDREALAEATPACGAPRPRLRVRAARAEADPEQVRRLAAQVRATRCGVLLCGPDDRDPALAAAAARFARAAGWPLLADGASPLRRGPHVPATPVCGAHDAFLRAERFAARQAPELVLRLGAPPTSQATARWLDRHPDAELWIADPEGGFADPGHAAREILRADPAALCHALADRLEAQAPRAASPWLAAFLAAERLAQAVLTRGIAAEPRAFAPAVVRALARALPEGAALFASNSMPVRDVEGFLPPAPRRLRVLASRGANGIDGIPSTALGAAAALGAPLALLTGDLAFLHDVGGLLAARRHGLSALIVVANDDGGGIFSHLPVAQFGSAFDFETLFAAPHGADLSLATALAGGRHEIVTEAAALDAALARGLAAGGLQVVEVPMERAANTAHHRALWQAVATAVDAELAP
ncbi:MAG: 2-succinyl-5-enolpyruvyl-6-hydroxy-3-cyclohexene-1-carboxylic-acid synthase [Deltaproteobacteria bacterium]|nr:2-succinyl-5-enolpyruvyl-6-hydroxy-3-cyclohexene-1-carboxylic-acid synthase [Deltaproteobacteria bacterium]